MKVQNSLTPGQVHHRLIHALTEHDRKQSTKAGYNPYALGIYLQRADEVVADIEAGADTRAAIMAGFEGRLADKCLKAIGMSATTEAESHGSWFYTPVANKS